MFERLMELLKETDIAFREGGWSTAPAGDYGAAALDGGADTVWADDQMREQAMSGAVHLFTRDDGRRQMALVQDALNKSGASWRLSYIGYEEDTRLTHYEWSFEMEAM